MIVNCCFKMAAIITLISAASLGVQLTRSQTGAASAVLIRSNESSIPMWLYDAAGSEERLETRLAKLLDRVGPNIRASADFHDYSDQTVDDSLLAWTQMQQRAQAYAQAQVEFYGPKVRSLLAGANVSSSCLKSANLTLAAMQNLDSWAIQLWNSIGSFPPIGLFGGEFSDLGSYTGCVDLFVPDRRINHTSYCTLAFRPIVASRRQFHMVFQREHRDLLDAFNRSNVFSLLANRAQYFHYFYMKTALCVPVQCSPEDMQQVAQAIGRKWLLSTGPVKCFTRAPPAAARKQTQLDRLDGFDAIENEPILVQINRNVSQIQMIAMAAIVIFYSLVLLASIWHALDICAQNFWLNSNSFSDIKKQQANAVADSGKNLRELSLEMMGRQASAVKSVAFNYLSIITNGREFLETECWKSNEITCLHGLRVLTMIWIITVHCLQYNEWSGFTRVFENEATLQSPFLHPIYNANYVVDNFFFMSGLLAAYSTWNPSKEIRSHGARILANIVGRYLRLTPQVLLVSLLYILLPLAGHGPFWYDMTEHAAKYCERNWWINLLHLQAFYREDQICNLVGWWISVDMLFYLTGLIISYLVITNRRALALQSTLLWLLCCAIISVGKHYAGGYPPNNLGTIPQVAEVWSRYVVNYFWSPFTHAYPFYLGLWVGYVLANNKWRRQIQSWSRFGTLASAMALICVNMSSHIWMSGALEIGDQWISTAYNCLCPIIWITGFAWLVIACHYNCMPLLNRILSLRLFVLLSKASFIIYLSHMLELRLYFGSRFTLLEVSVVSICFIIVGNALMSIIFGVFLCITFEGPSMKFQRFVANKIKSISNQGKQQQQQHAQTIDIM